MSGEPAATSLCARPGVERDALAEVADERGQAPADQPVADRDDDEQRRTSVEEGRDAVAGPPAPPAEVRDQPHDRGDQEDPDETDDRAGATDDAAGGIDQLLAPEQRDHHRCGDPAELPAAGDERPDPGERRGDQERDEQRTERGVRADGGVEPRGQDDRGCEEQRVPRPPDGALHAADLHAGRRTGVSLRSGRVVPTAARIAEALDDARDVGAEEERDRECGGEHGLDDHAARARIDVDEIHGSAR